MTSGFYFRNPKNRKLELRKPTKEQKENCKEITLTQQ